MTSDLRGALFMVAAMAGFAVEDALFKAATAEVSAGLATLVFGLVGLAGFAALARAAGQPVWSRAYLGRTMLWRSGFEIMGRLFYALALAFAPLSATTAILQAAPLVVTLGAALVLGEAVGPRRWLAVAVGFLGVLLILRPAAGAFEATTLFALLGMIGFAGRDLATRASPPGLSAAQLGVTGFAVVSTAGLILLALEGLPATLPGPRPLALLAGTAGVGVLAYGALTRAMRTGDVSVVAPFRYVRLIFAFLLAFAIFGERPDGTMLAGAALIVGSGLYTLFRTRRAGAGARG